MRRALALGAVLASLYTTAGCSDRASGTQRAAAPPAVPILAAEAVRKDVPLDVGVIGTVQALTTVGVKAQVAGQVVQVHFKEGQDVKAGQLLFTIDPRPFEATVAQAEANVGRDTAQLRQAEAAQAQRQAEVQQALANLERDQAQLENARVQERRFKTLVEKELVARELYDQFRTNLSALGATVNADRAAIENARAAALAAQAGVDNARAVIRADEAMVQTARLNLGYTTIRAPMEGRTGNLMLQAGNVVKGNDDNPMVVIAQVHPIYVSFAVPQQYLAAIKQHQAAGPLTVRAIPTGAPKPTTGRLTFVNNTVDPSTATTELFIRRPVLTTLLMAAVLIFGVMAYQKLPVNDLPNVDFPTIQVIANLPGASPETMASAVATPLERQFTTIAGIDSMTSTSALGVTQITIQFTLDRNIDAAGQDVQAAITKASPLLPPGMPTPPFYQKVNPADQPVLYMALSSPTQPLYTVDEYAQTFLAQRISTVSGVAQVTIFGSQKYAVRVQVDPRALAARGIGLDEVEAAISRANVNKPTGTLWGASQAYNVQATGQLMDAAAYRPMIVAYRNGFPVRLEELGRVVDGVQTDKVAGWFNGERAVVLAVQRQPGTNTIEVVDAIRKLLPVFNQQLPAAVNLNVLFDRSAAIRESVHDVQFTLLLTIALVVMVIFLFLRNVSATIIPSLAVPLSIVGTFAIMFALGYTIDIISLMALTLCVGFVVDDAVVMLENIVRHMEHGEDRMTAALRGAREIGFTILSMTLSLAAVFIPVLFMGGVVGRLLHEFAITIGAR